MLLSDKNCQFPQYVSIIIGTLSAFSVGQCLSWSSSAIPLLERTNLKLKVTREESSWIVSLIALGAVIGAIPAGTLSNRFGPKRMLIILSILILIAWNLIAFGSNVWWLYVARLLLGIALGGICVITPIFITDISEEAITSKLNGIFQIQFTLGILFQFILGKSIEDFQSLALASTCVTIIFLITFSFIPESPIYLIKRKNYRLAKTNLQLFRWNYDVNDELENIKDKIENEEVNTTKIKIIQLIHCKATSKAIVISLGLMVFQQLSGINVILFYAAQIFNDFSTSFNGDSCTIFIGILQVIGASISTIVIDCCGRRTLLIISSGVMWICLSILSLYYYMKQYNNDMEQYSLLPLIIINLYIFIFSIGLGPIPWILMAEIFVSNIKSLAISITVATNWLFAFVVLKTFQDVLEQFGPTLTFGFYSFICFICLVFVIGLVPEYKCRNIDDVIQLLSDDIIYDDEEKQYLLK